MNKLIIVGNGFDIHNGLATRYSDFLEWYLLREFRKAVESPGWMSEFFHLDVKEYINNSLKEFNDDECLEAIRSILNNLDQTGTNTVKLGDSVVIYSFEFTSLFFEAISEHYRDVNWVDIEMIYYKLLNGCLGPIRGAYDPSNNCIDDLNYDLDRVKELLLEYLIEISKSYLPKMAFNKFAEMDIDPKFINDKEHRRQLTSQRLLSLPNQKIKVKNVLFLNFNYTGLTHHFKGSNYQTIDIHGSLEDPKNPAIFGYGDELDEDYLVMEKTNDNRFFKHIKSFGYFNAPNYSDLLRFIDSDIFVAYIWGHSCGLSDRTLLNEIFEHDNCAAIQPSFWDKGDGEDNYTEITQNISRHFRSKQKLRNRLVDRTSCYPLGADL
ncbi:AbiH family protein [Sphingobacterium chungjuense]|uniref:AbiH family protein n=1 Tax=Sphingobacterium chungjuense TaxID=2675553 RepID=UPI00140D97B6|nr:AbiH family protein [Sphingobacterium chungjuense]